MPKSLRHSCRSELARQGISLIGCYNLFRTAEADWSFPPVSVRRRTDRTISSSSDGTGKRAGVWSLRILKTSDGLMEQLKQPSPSTNPTTHPAVVSLSCWSSAPRTLSLPRISRRYTELTTRRVVEDPPGFPAYSRLRTTPSPVRGAAPSACLRASYLRTVIVTAAVYWRLGSELRSRRS